MNIEYHIQLTLPEMEKEFMHRPMEKSFSLSCANQETQLSHEHINDF